MITATDLGFALEYYARTMRLAGRNDAVTSDMDRAAAELRRLDEVNAGLLEALENMLMHIGIGREESSEWVCEPIHSDEIKAARAAIAKARGEA